MNTEMPMKDNQNKLLVAIANADALLNKSYLSALDSAKVVEQYPIVTDNAKIIASLNKEVRFFDITQIVLNKNENMRDKLVTVFNSVSGTGASLLMHIKGSDDKVQIRFGVKNADRQKLALSQEILEKNLKANFPGSIFVNCDKNAMQSKILDALPLNGYVSSVTDIAGLRYENETKDRQFMQGIEKLIDTLQGEEYSLLLIADPVSSKDLDVCRHSLENLYTSLVPYSESQYSVGENESDSVNQSVSQSVTDTVNESVTNTISHTVGKSTSRTDGTNSSTSFNLSPIAGLIGGAIGFCVGGPAGAMVGGAIGSSLGGGISRSKGKSHSETETDSESSTDSTANTHGTSHSESQTSTEGSAHSRGSSRGLQIKFENHTVKQLMVRIDEMLKRYNTCADLGMWNCAVYCISEKSYVSQMAACAYRSLIRGKNSSLENGGITIWNKDQSKLVISSLKNMAHPLLDFGECYLTPGTLVSSKELAIEASLPNRSVPGIPVLECAEFGRTVSSYDVVEKSVPIRMGNIFNMHCEENMPVELDENHFSSHTFITGSTGSGKSNTIYHILNSLKKNGKHFLVVEPAKGEYKFVLGQNENDGLHCDVHVYGTNPDISSLLRLNPFSFPHGNSDVSKNIHILEHLDRLVEIFNVCWPMYAAMPAVLKEAIEKSYEDCGWNLVDSTNEYGENYYPNFTDIVRNIRDIIDRSDYDAENKGAYKGSLVTRLKSLTNGINGLIFTDDEISAKDLFDENVIVDLSRVGSAETKSLIMGLLVLKLQEYRMTNSCMNVPLKHVTVLEEAHNLLKRTSTNQSQDSGNLLGKSVEMLANSIAEMRTYGEGFIIADQAPALLDMSVIRNTNTKIILRLPDQGDRELVGLAANLNKDQITELAKLPCGVAAIYQNEWVEPVLCKIEKTCFDNSQYKRKYEKREESSRNVQDRMKLVKMLCSSEAVGKEVVARMIENISLPASVRVTLLNYSEKSHREPKYRMLGSVVKELLPQVYNAFIRAYTQTSIPSDWSNAVDDAIIAIDGNIEVSIMRDIRQIVATQYLINENSNERGYNEWRQNGVI